MDSRCGWIGKRKGGWQVGRMEAEAMDPEPGCRFRREECRDWLVMSAMGETQRRSSLRALCLPHIPDPETVWKRRISFKELPVSFYHVSDTVVGTEESVLHKTDMVFPSWAYNTGKREATLQGILTRIRTLWLGQANFRQHNFNKQGVIIFLLHPIFFFSTRVWLLCVLPSFLNISF